MADANWSNLLHTALEEWSAGRLERAGRSFTRVLEDCQIPEMLVWRAFVHNQLALLSQESGDWEEARLHWQAARESWQESSLSASSPELRATLAWYLDLLEHHQFHPRARELKQLIDRGLPPLLDPWQGGATLATAPLARTTPLAKTELNQPSYAPMGGQTVSLERKSSVTGSWTDLISQALELSARSNFARALHLFDQARHQVVDRRVTHPHLVAMVYCAESIGAFIAGNYPQAEKAREQASEIWRSPKSGDEDLQSFAQALSAGGQETAAVLFMIANNFC